jgi:FAD/FMN-containing dehydrogenase
LRARTLDGRDVVLESSLAALQARLRGPVLAPGEDGYAESRTVWNAMIDRRPALVMRCLGTADVLAAVQFAREHGLLLCIKGSQDDDANIGWARAAWNDMKAFSTGGTYINFLTADEGPERTAAALGPAMQRLAAVKARWDPHNLFRTNRNIAPGPA